MGSDDTITDDDLDLDDDVDTDDDTDNFLDLDPEPDPEVAPAQRQRAQKKVKEAFERERQQSQQREAKLMDSLKEAWGAEAARQFPLADLGAIGLTGIDPAAKEKFLTEVQAQHEAREHALAQAGYVRLDADGNPVAPAPAADGTKDTAAVGSRVEAERQQAAAWGKPVSGTDSQTNVRAQDEKELMDSMKQGPKGVIELMFRKNKGLADFITRKP